MYDRSLILEQLSDVEEAIRRIERRFQGVASADDFVADESGLDRLDGIAMMLIVIGESFKKIDKITKGKLLERFPEINWPGVKGTRDILAHDYSGIDHEEIYHICLNDLQPLKHAVIRMREELADGAAS
jgi:uncharacterized protein with HEPN domain